MTDNAVLLAASPGGHLAELVDLSSRLVGASRTRVWAVHPSEQIGELLAGDESVVVPYTAPRDVVGVMRNARILRRAIRSHEVAGVLTTGAGIGLSALIAGRSLGIPGHYVELAARSDGPSLTGRAASALPGVSTLTQYPDWSLRGWTYCGSVFDDFVPTPAERPVDRALRVFITVGLNSYPFGRMLDAAQAAIPSGAETRWQTGTAAWAAKDGTSKPTMGSDEVQANMAWADVVVSHAGTGSSLAALHAGKRPILVPRRADRDEHVDDHQRQISQGLATRKLAVDVDADELTSDVIEEAARWRVTAAPASRAPIELAGVS